MAKTVTIRLSDADYKKISISAEAERRPLSNFITYATLEKIENSVDIDPFEMAQIKSDKKLLGKLKKAHQEAKKMKGKFIDRI